MSLRTTGRRSLTAGVALAAGVALVFMPQPASGAPPSLADSVAATMIARHGATAQRDFGTASVPTPLVEPSRQAGNSWAFGTTTIPVPVAEHGTPLSSIFVARLDRGGWRVELDGTAGFVDLARQAPASVVKPDEKQLFAQNYQASQSIQADTGLGLPWPQGVAWTMGGGPHGYSGNSRPFSSIDFNGGDGRVLSAGAGKVFKSCVSSRSALVKVVHPNGYSTSYYHMTSLTTLGNGASVQTGTYLGRIGNELPCGGSSSGAHVHLTLYRGDTQISVHNMTIGGWTFFEGAQAYGGFAQRGSTRVGVGGRLTNFGGGGTPSLPTGTVNAGSNTSVNVRSGPSLSAGIIDTLANGTVVQISCTTRGDTVQGVWGPTDLWDRLNTGGYVSDGFIDTGSNEPVAPACT